MDAKRAEELAQLLIDVRRIPARDAKTRAWLQDAALHQLTKSIFITNEVWWDLLPHELEYLRCVAASSQSKKAVLVGRSAARVSGVWVMPAKRERVQLCLPSGRPPSTKGADLGYEYLFMALADDDIVRSGSLRFTNVVRTAIDIARTGTFVEGVVAFESILSGCNDFAAKQIRIHIRRKIELMRGTKGIGKARHTLAEATTLSVSPYETWLRLVLEAHGYRVRAQMQIGPYRVDLLVDENCVVEVDGRAKYGDVPQDVVMKQRKREDWLREKGFYVLRVYTSDVGKWSELAPRIDDARNRALTHLPVAVEPRQYFPMGWGRDLHWPDALEAEINRLR